MVPQWILSLLILPLLHEVCSAARRISIGPDAQKACRHYRRVCGEGRFCAMEYYTTPRNRSHPVCVPEYIIKVTEPTGVTNFCDLQKVTGDCRARFIRWYFDANEQKCKWFYYGGCGGNENNFKSRDSCLKACPTRGYAQRDNSLSSRPKPVSLPLISPVKMSEPLFLPENPRPSQEPRILKLQRTNRSHSVSSRKEYEKRRKRRLRRRRKIKKLRRKRRRLLKRGKKKRREGKIRGRNRKTRKHKRRRKNKNNKKRKNKTNRQTENSSPEIVTTTSGPDDRVNSNKRNPSRTLTVLQGVHSEIKSNNADQS